MSKKLAKTVLSAAMAGVLFGVSFDIMAADEQSYSALNAKKQPGVMYKIIYNPDNKTAHINWGPNGSLKGQENKPIPLLSKIDGNGNVTITSADGSTTFTVYDKEVHDFMKAVPLKAFGNGDLLTEQNIRDLYNRVSAIQQMETNVGLDEYGNVAATPGEIKERVSLQRYLAGEAASSTIGLDKNGKLTEDEKNIVTPLRINDGVVTVANELDAQKGKLDAQKGELEAQKQNLGKLTTRTDKIDAAAAATAAKVESRTLVGVSSDGTLTRAEGAKNTISVNDGLVALSGRTDRIDAAVGAIDGRVTRNTQSIEKNSKAIAANTRTLQQHSARLDSQQRQINENHKEMKRAAAQSAALTGLFQPYSVGKFNATAAVGGYSDQQALAVGVGYRFNEQTAAKAGVAFSDGDASWNVGVNFEF
ncbi:YadA C-terminal domain-containing protein [Escherichia coli]|uniref:YadA C-terminal domain-containing protein n=1 Tax=Escherichia coli TaxID=562 RepID=UPI0024DE7F59|nr:YadA C-terminal domain-containing protein [Escherichia coli]MDK2489339.1 YadA C-terminal domain-containing protein [Escherichia coli]MDK2532997.1 YadA C-terminal domain-containing protein [Escherichia coli]